MLKNKKKLRRLERNTPSYAAKTAQTLVLAGALLLGGAGLASAADITWGDGNDITITTDYSETTTANTTHDAKSLTIGNGIKFTIVGGTQIKTNDATITGATLSFTRSDNLQRAGLVTRDLATPSTFKFLGGSNVTLANGSSIGGATATITITDSTFTMSGQHNDATVEQEAWRRGSLLYGDNGVTIGGSSVINMGDYAIIMVGTKDSSEDAGGTLTIQDTATVNLNGSAVDKAAVLRASNAALADAATIKMTGGTLKVDTSKFGAIASMDTKVSGGTIHVAGTLTVGGALDTGSGKNSADWGSVDGTFTLSDKGKIEVVDGGQLKFIDTTTFTSTGGEINLFGGGRLLTDKGDFTAGTIKIDGTDGKTYRSGIYDSDNNTKGTYTFGDVAVTDNTKLKVDITNGGAIEASNVTINSGTFTVSGKGTFDPAVTPAWYQRASIQGDDSLIITGGDITVGAEGMLLSGGGGSGIQIQGGTVHLAGTSTAAALLRSGNAALTNGKLDIGGGANTATVNVADGKYGLILSPTINIEQYGLLSVEAGGSLLLSSVATPDNAVVTAGLTVDSTTLDIKSNGTVDVEGNVLITDNNTSNGIIKVNAGGTLNVNGDLKADGGSLDMAGGTATVEGTASFGNVGASGLLTSASGTGNLIVGALNLTAVPTTGSTKLTVDGGLGATFLGVENSTTDFFNGTEISVTTGTLNLGTDGTDSNTTYGGTYAGKVSVTGTGALNVKGNKWTLSHADGLAQSAGTVAINDGGHLVVKQLNQTAGVINLGGTTVGKLTVEGAVKNIAYTASTAGVNVKNLGVLEAKYDKVVAADGKALASGVSKIEVGVGGTIVLTGMEGQTLDLANVKLMKGNLFNNTTNTGLVEISKAKITGEGTIANASGILSPDVSVKDIANNAGGNLSLGVKDITLTGATADIALKADDLRLVGGTTDGSLVTATKADGTVVKTNITVNNGGALTLGSANNTDPNSKTQGTLNGNVVLGSGTEVATMNAVNGTFTVGDITSTSSGASTLNVAAATLNAENIGATGTNNSIDSVNVSGNLNAKDVYANEVDLVGGNLNAANVTVGTGNASVAGGSMNVTGTLTTTGDLLVGDSTAAGHINATGLKLNGNTLFADPSWVNGDSSTVAVKDIGTDGKTIDGKVIAGQNSHITIGLADNGAWMAKNLQYAAVGGKLTEGDITAAMGIYKPLSLDNANGAILVDGNQIDQAIAEGAATVKTATFTNKSLLAVYAPNTLTTAALTGGGTGHILTVNANAKLMVVDGKVGDTVKITDNFGGTNVIGDKDTSWNGSNLLTNSDMVKGTGTWNEATGKYDVVLSRGARAQDLFPKLDGELSGIVNKMYDMGVNNTQSGNAGIKFLSRATANNERYVANTTEAAATIEGAARLAVVGATQGITMSAATAGTSAATSRTSMASPLQSQKAQVVALNGETVDSGLNAGDVRNGVGLWIMPLYQSNTTWGMKAGEFKTGYTSDLGGVAIGADYTLNEAFRVGVAFNIGGGFAKSSGDFNKTENNFNFWGVNLYSGWTQNNFGLTADVGYTSTYSKVEQSLQASMDMGAIKADVTSSAITAGLRGEYKFETEALDIIPHVAVRYMSLKTDSYDAKSNGTIFNADETNQSIWTFPIGVTLTKDIVSSSGWTFKPQMDLQVIPAAGDVKAKSKVRVPGIDASADLSTRVMDDISYGGGVGFEVGKGDVSFGLNYNIQASEHRTGHGVFGTLRYEF